MAATEKEPGDYIRDPFCAALIFACTDQQALDECVVYDVVPVSRHGVNRARNSVYTSLGGFDRPDDLAAQYREPKDAAKPAFDRSVGKELVEFHYRRQRFWMMDNETGATTIMLPEDR